MIRRHASKVQRFGKRARMVLLAFAVLAFVSQGALLSSALFAQQTERGRELGKRVKCMCGGCNDSATGCNHTGGAFSGPCDTAKGMQSEINERVTRNESDDLTLQAFVQEYGPEGLQPRGLGYTRRDAAISIRSRLGCGAPLAAQSHIGHCLRPCDSRRVSGARATRNWKRLR